MTPPGLFDRLRSNGSGFTPVAVSARRPGRLDQPATARRNRLSPSRESRPSRAARSAPSPVHRRSAHSIGGQGEKPGTPRAPAVRDEREPGPPPRLASASHRAEVRRPAAPRTRTAADDRRDSATGGAYGDGESRLGLHTHSRGARESGPRRGTRDYRYHPQAARD